MGRVQPSGDAEEMDAASTPLAAAIPACKGFAIVPNCALTPDAIEETKPIAKLVVLSSNSSNLDAAIVAPKAPAVAVEW